MMTTRSRCLNLLDQVVPVECGEHGHGNGDEKPEPRQPVALGEELGGIKPSARDTWGAGNGGGCLMKIGCGRFHGSQ